MSHSRSPFVEQNGKRSATSRGRGNGHARSATLGVRLENSVRHERQRALRALLQHPLLTAGGVHAFEFGLVRRHTTWLRNWLSQNCGWTLQVESEVARLRKTPADATDSTRPARDRKSQTPFTRRRYVLLCLALAALERSDRQITLGRLAEELVVLTVSDPALAEAGITFDLSSQDQRRDLVQVIRFLLDLQVLVRLDGDEQDYLNGRGDALYRIHRPILAGMMNTRQGPSTVSAKTLDQRIAALVEDPRATTADARDRQLHSRLVRRLLDDPVLYYDELNADELDYLRQHRKRLLRQVAEATGLIPEVRREGIAFVDDRGDLIELDLPEEGTDGHVTLLLAEYLADRLRDDSDVIVERSTLHRYTADLICRHRTRWRRSAAEPGAEVVLTAQALDRLEALRLVRITVEGVRPLPAIARYALNENDQVPPGN